MAKRGYRDELYNDIERRYEEDEDSISEIEKVVLYLDAEWFEHWEILKELWNIAYPDDIDGWEYRGQLVRGLIEKLKIAESEE